MDSIAEAVSRLQNCGLKCGYSDKEQAIRGGINPRTEGGIKVISDPFGIKIRGSKWIAAISLRQLWLEETFDDLVNAVEFVCKCYEKLTEFAATSEIEETIGDLEAAG